MGIITLTTDFGLRDAYVGAMKGVILGLAPEARIVDITHDIAPQDVDEAAFVLASAAPHFPQGTVHVAVVDPGVGTSRRGIVAETARSVLIGPDNGIFSGVLASEPAVRIHALENRQLMRPDVSATFHGRDVFAPAGAHIVLGERASAFGQVVRDPVTADLWQTEGGQGAISGRVVHTDRFGNCITGIRRDQVDRRLGDAAPRVTVGGHRFGRILGTYGEGARGEALAYYGSLDTLEIGVNGGSAAALLGLTRGDVVRVDGLAKPTGGK